MAYNKYKTKRTESHGRSFASRGESDCYQMLQLMEKAGEIEVLQCQDHVYLTDAKITYIVDFRILDKTLSRMVWVEYKGFETPEWRLKRRLWKFYGPGPLRIYKGYGLRVTMTEEIIPT